MIALRLIAAILCCAAFSYGSSVLIPLTLGYFLFSLLEPLVSWLKTKGISRTLSSIVLVAAAMTISGFCVWGIYGAVADIARDVPAYSSKLKSLASAATQKAALFEKNANTAVPQSNEAQDVQRVQIVQGYTGWTNFALKGLGTVFEALAEALFIPLIALFFLIDRVYLGKAIAGVLPKDFDATHAAREIYNMVRGFFVGNLIIGGAMAVCLSVLYSCLGLHNAIPLGIATGFLNLIPLAGPVFSLVFPLLQGLLQFNTVAPFVIIASAVLILHIVVSNVIVPKVVGSHINVNVSAATIGLLFWGWVWGALGLLLAVPMVAVGKIILDNRPQWRAYAKLFSETQKANQAKPIRSMLTRRFENEPSSAQ